MNSLLKIRGDDMENINLNNIKGKRVLIVGMGKSGVAAIQAMLKLGAEVTVQAVSYTHLDVYKRQMMWRRH